MTKILFLFHPSKAKPLYWIANDRFMLDVEGLSNKIQSGTWKSGTPPLDEQSKLVSTDGS